MNYHWDLEKLRKHQKIIQNCLQITEGLTKEDIQFLKKNITQLKELQDILLVKTPNNKCQKIEYMDSDKILPVDTYFDYQSIPDDIKETLLTATKLLKDLDDTYDNISLPKLNLSNQELVEMSYDFYSTLPDSSFLQEFMKYTNPKKNLLQFEHLQEDFEIFGQIYTFYYPKYIPYFLIYRRNDINDFLSLNHEISHGIMYQYDTYMMDRKNPYFLTELEGYFFDYLSIQYLKHDYPKKVINQLEYDRITNALEDFSNIFITDAAIQLVDNNQKITVSDIQNGFQKYDLPFYINSDLLKENLCVDIRFHSCHALSFLTSLDLENIYERDPERAFYLFQKIRNNKTNNVFQNLKENGISFAGDNENYRSFQKKIKWINKLGNQK